MVQVKWTTTNHTKCWSTFKESGVVYMVGLEGSPLLWAPFGKVNYSFQNVPLWIRPTESSTWQKASRIVNRKYIIFHQDNIRAYVYLMIRKKLLHLGWEVLIHLLYSPDIASLDLHLIRSLKIFLNRKNFHSLENCKKHLEQLFAQKDKKLWEDVIMKLPLKMAEGSGTNQWIYCSLRKINTKLLVKIKQKKIFFVCLFLL